VLAVIGLLVMGGAAAFAAGPAAPPKPLAFGKVLDANMSPVTTMSPSEFVRFAAAGAMCCGMTHLAVVPIDVVKTSAQANPKKYNKGWHGNTAMLLDEFGPSVLMRGAVPTLTGYSIQGIFKFGGNELIKRLLIGAFGMEWACGHRFLLVLMASFLAEVVADLFLCPFEATRIRMVADRTMPRNQVEVLGKIVQQEGILAPWKGLVPLMCRQLPYTMAKFATQDYLQKTAYLSFSFLTPPNLWISVGSGVVGGIMAAIVSQPADTVLSTELKKEGRSLNKAIKSIYTYKGLPGFFTGLKERSVMDAIIAGGQFFIYDSLKILLKIAPKDIVAR